MKLSKINWELVGVLIAIVVMFGSMYLLFTMPQPLQQIYNCSIAVFSPDYPIAVKEGFRKLRADKIK
jgi:hypothetical protein